jgi:hypothetical protein
MTRVPAPMTPVADWVRLGLVALAVPQVVTGTWALVDASHWFDHFPGFDPRLAAAEPPFNAHLATDAGAGFLARSSVHPGSRGDSGRPPTPIASRTSE